VQSSSFNGTHVKLYKGLQSPPLHHHHFRHLSYVARFEIAALSPLVESTPESTILHLHCELLVLDDDNDDDL
jgi:hypothetical protein